MVADAEAHADEAHKLRELAEARNQAETLAYPTEKSLAEHRESLDEETVKTIEGRIEELNGVARRRRRRPRSGRRPRRSWRPRTSSRRPCTRRCRPSRRRRSPPATAATARADDDEVVEEADYEVIDEEAKKS